MSAAYGAGRPTSPPPNAARMPPGATGTRFPDMRRHRAALGILLACGAVAASAAPAHARFVTLPVQLPAGVDAVTQPAAGLDGTLWTVGVGVNAPTNALLRVDPRTGAIVG